MNVLNGSGLKFNSAAPSARLTPLSVIYLHHLGVNQTRAREQTNLRRILDDMIV